MTDTINPSTSEPSFGSTKPPATRSSPSSARARRTTSSSEAAPRAPTSGSACRTTPTTTARSSDFRTDFDHADPAYNPNAPEVWKELREGGCPVAHSDRYGGMWVPLTNDTVTEIAYDTDNFTSRCGRRQRRPAR